MLVWVDNDSYNTWESLKAPVLELGEVFGLGLMGLTHLYGREIQQLVFKVLGTNLRKFSVQVCHAAERRTGCILGKVTNAREKICRGSWGELHVPGLEEVLGLVCLPVPEDSSWMKALLSTVVQTNDFLGTHISFCTIKILKYKIKGFYYLLGKYIYWVSWNRTLPKFADSQVMVSQGEKELVNNLVVQASLSFPQWLPAPTSKESLQYQSFLFSSGSGTHGG